MFKFVFRYEITLEKEFAYTDLAMPYVIDGLQVAHEITNQAKMNFEFASFLYCASLSKKKKQNKTKI